MYNERTGGITMTTKTTDRFDMRIDHNVKNKAQNELKKHGMTLTEYVRSNLTTIANYGLPRNFGLNSDQEARWEAKHWKLYPRFSSVKDMMRYLND